MCCPSCHEPATHPASRHSVPRLHERKLASKGSGGQGAQSCRLFWRRLHERKLARRSQHAAAEAAAREQELYEAHMLVR